MVRRLASPIAGLVMLCGAAGGCATGADSQSQELGRVFSEILGGAAGGQVGLTEAEIRDGLKEALTVGVDRAAGQLGAPDGFWANAEVRIPLPGVLKDVQERLDGVGLSGPLDDLQTRLNRGAEAAMPSAKALVVSAVQSMTIEDAIGVLRGGDTAATDFLRGRTEDGLRTALSPYVESALSDVGALDALDNAVNRYAAGLVRSDARGMLVENAVEGALDGLFLYLAREETAIRRDPVKRTTELLRRVFGG